MIAHFIDNLIDILSKKYCQWLDFIPNTSTPSPIAKSRFSLEKQEKTRIR